MYKLRVLEAKDASGILEWMKNSEINRFFRFNPEKITEETVMDFIENSMSDTTINYAVVDEEDEYLGTISLKNINSKDKNAEYAVSFRRKSIGTGAAAFATKEIIRLGFEEWDLHKIYLNVLSDNERAIKFYTKMGFEYEGEFKDHVFINGQFKNLKWYGIRREKNANR